MKNEITLNLRRFLVSVRDDRTGDTRDTLITLEKSQLQACQLVGQSSTDLIHRMYSRKGYTVLAIGKPSKLAVTLGLDELWRRYSEEQDERNKWNYLYGASGGEAGV